jgi:putative salt-induced outer membrane protein YdiY
MFMFRGIVLSLLLCSVSAPVKADQVALNNGDRLTGEIVKSDGKTLTLKTESAGTVEIKWSAIKAMSSEKPVYVETTSTKKTYSGIIGSQDDSLVVTSPTNQTAMVTKSDVAALRSAEEQQAYEKAQHPGLLEGWTGGANIGFGLTAGNSQTENLGLAFNAARKGLRDKLSLYTTSVYSTNNAPGASPSTTANTIQGGARYDHDLTTRVFAFVGADFMADALQGLNLRSVFGGGLGYHVIKNENTTLDLLGGANYTRENYTTLTRNFAGATLGEEFMHKLGRTTLTQKAYFYPDLSDSGEYRTEFDFGSVTKINKWFGWQNTFSDIYVTNPPAGKKRNDVIFTTGLNVAFTH